MVWMLTVVKGALGERADDLRWRAAAIEDAQQVGTPFFADPHSRHLAEFAALAVFDPRWRGVAYTRWRTPPTAGELLEMDAAEAAAAFTGLAPSLARDLARRHTRIIAGLDGVPSQFRYLANDLLIAEEIKRLEQQIATLHQPQTGPDGSGSGLDMAIEWFSAPALAETAAAALAERAAEYRRWLREDRQILLFDPAGDGRVVEVFGDLAGATCVGVVVPGMSNSIANFSSDTGGFRDNARRLFEASAGTDGVATIAWLGYDTPDNVGAAVRSAAIEGAPDLASFLEGIDPIAVRSVSVVAHSYGSVLAGVAARHGIAADNLVFVGSPGTTLNHAGDAVLRPQGRVWAALAEDDPIAWGIAPSELPTWPVIPSPIGYLIDAFRAFRDADDLWHGTNPVSDEFGAMRIDTDGSVGHSGYFEAGSLDNLALIVTGRYREVDQN